jgi:hypothetical protein
LLPRRDQLAIVKLEIPARANALAPEPPTSTAMETPTTETPTATTATLAKVDVAECHSEPPFPVTRAFSSPPEG